MYHSVSDMKFDHFGSCKALPPKLRAEFNSLKEESKKRQEKKKSTNGKLLGYSSTAQYYHDVACEMGMVDCQGGVFLKSQLPPAVSVESTSTSSSHQRRMAQKEAGKPLNKLAMSLDAPSKSEKMELGHPIAPIEPPLPVTSGNIAATALLAPPALLSPGLLPPALVSLFCPVVPPPNPTNNGAQYTLPLQSHSGKKLLASAVDHKFLNPLHCFIRQQIEVFAADEKDIAGPAPGRKSRVLLGQVGIRCIHCTNLSSKERVKRAVMLPTICKWYLPCRVQHEV